MSRGPGADHSRMSVSRGSSSCSMAVARRDCISPVAKRCAVETRPIWLLSALGHRRLEAVLDHLGVDAPRLVDDGEARRVAVDGDPAADHPAAAVGSLDLLLAVLLADDVAVVLEAVRPRPGGPLDLLGDRQVLGGVQDELGLAEALGLVDAPEHQLAQQPTTCRAGRLSDHSANGKTRAPSPSCSSIRTQREPLPPPERLAEPLLGPRDRLGAVGTRPRRGGGASSAAARSRNRALRGTRRATRRDPRRDRRGPG